MWEERQIELLRDEVEAVLSSLADTTGLYDLVKQPLSESTRVLDNGNARRRFWPLLPLMVCEAISGDYQRAIPAAASIQILMAAGDVFDDIEDADSSDSLLSRYGPAIAINVATTLFSLAEQAITRLKGRGVSDSTIVLVTNVVNSLCTTACKGQHLDLYSNLREPLSENTYLRILGMKSASQVECACYVGALLSTNSKKLSKLFALFGHYLGMAAQITNDIQGITRGNDIVKHQITLPIIYVLNQPDDEVRNQFEAEFLDPSKPVPDIDKVRDLLFRTGAIHYSILKMEYYSQQALDILSQAEASGARIERLKLLFE